MPSRKFDLGQLLATPGATKAMEEARQDAGDFLRRHAAGVWGLVGPQDAAANERALKDGSRILSVYKTRRGIRLWVITEAADDAGRRAATTILLPSEY